MSTSEAYLCKDCLAEGNSVADFALGTVVCVFCGKWVHLAPWSYLELLTAIGLVAMYRQFIEVCLKQGVLISEPETWLALPALTAMTPSMLIRSLQAGCVHVPLSAEWKSPPRKPLILAPKY